MFEEIANSANSLFKVIHAWQGHYTEVVRPRPVEGGALNDKQFFRKQKIQNKLFIIVDWANLWIDPGEGI